MSTPDPFTELRAELQRMKQEGARFVVCPVAEVEKLLATWDECVEHWQQATLRRDPFAPIAVGVK